MWDGGKMHEMIFPDCKTVSFCLFKNKYAFFKNTLIEKAKIYCISGKCMIKYYYIFEDCVPRIAVKNALIIDLFEIGGK